MSEQVSSEAPQDGAAFRPVQIHIFRLGRYSLHGVMRSGFRRHVQDVCLRCSGSRHGWLFPWPNRSAPPGPWPPCLASPTLPGSSSLRSAPTRLAPPGVSRPWLVPPRDSVSRNIFQWGVTCLFSFLGRPHLRNVFRIALLIGCCGFG